MLNKDSSVDGRTRGRSTRHTTHFDKTGTTFLQRPTEGGKPDYNVDSLPHDSGIKFNGTFASMKRTGRITLYKAKIAPDGQRNLLLEVQRDTALVNQIFIVIQNPVLQYDQKEYSITLKQAANLLVKCNHQWKEFVAEILTLKDGQVQLRNLVTKVFNPVIDGIPHPPTPEYVPQLNLDDTESEQVYVLDQES